MKSILKEVLIDTLKNDKNLYKALNKASKIETTLHIESNKNGEANIIVKGTNMSILIALASLEKSILEKYDVPEELFELVKMSVEV